MKVALITDTHWGIRNDSQVMLDNMKKFIDDVFFPTLRSHGIDANIYIAWSRECSSNGNEENDWVKLKKGYVQDYFKEP